MSQARALAPPASRWGMLGFHGPWHRQLLLAICVIVLVGTGSVLGWQGAVILQYKQASYELDQTAARIERRLHGIIEESRGVFESLDALGLAHCSDELLLEMRTRMFEARFIKDIGGIRNHSLYCSTALGRLEEPLVSGPPDLALASGMGMRTDRSVLASARLRTLVIEGNNFNALVDPRVVTDLIADLQEDQIFLSSANGNLREWHPFQSSQVIEEQRFRSRPAGLVSEGCNHQSGVCVKLQHLPSVAEVGQRETRFVISSLGGALGLGFFLGGLSLARQRRLPEYALRRAIAQQQIQAVYQPILNLPDQQNYAFEALARWVDDSLHPVPADEFIALAERCGMIHQISSLMIRRVGEELGDWLSQSSQRRVALNIAPSELTDDELLVNLERHLLARGVQPQQILLEITERTMLTSDTAGARIEALARRGFRVYADDFGVGYCGLAYLNDLEMDGIKISQTFTAAVGTESPKATLVPNIIEMARELGLEVIVEGVESEAQCQALTGLGAVKAQGWYFARELPATEIIARFS